MAGNNPQPGRRKPGAKKGATVGTGGHGRRRLEGKGPTPPAEQRPGHPAARRAAAGAKRSAGLARTAKHGGGARAPRTRADRRGLEIVAGRNAVVEAFRAGVPVTALYVASRIEADDRVREVIKRAADTGVPVLEAPRPELDRLTSGALHQGLAVQVPTYDYAHPADLLDRARKTDQAPLIVALDGVTDPRNLGAVVRSAAAFGAHGVVVPERRAAGMTAGAWKASAGAAARVPVARATNMTRALVDYQRAGLIVVGLEAGGEADVDDFELAADPLVVVVGAEGAGLSRLVRDTCDLRIRVPMVGAVESLNAGVAAGIVLYEIARRRAGMGRGVSR
jgi:23S rRNA (guanosine2251-2'-O)-methyltransferase